MVKHQKPTFEVGFLFFLSEIIYIGNQRFEIVGFPEIKEWFCSFTYLFNYAIVV